MHQKWPNQIFPIVKFVFPVMAPVVWAGGVQGGGGHHCQKQCSISGLRHPPPPPSHGQTCSFFIPTSHCFTHRRARDRSAAKKAVTTASGGAFSIALSQKKAHSAL